MLRHTKHFLDNQKWDMDVHRLSSLLSGIVFEVLAIAIRDEKEITIVEEEVKISLFADDVTLCLKDASEFTRKLLDLINIYSKVPGYKKSIFSSKKVNFIHSNSLFSEQEIRKNIPFKITFSQN